MTQNVMSGYYGQAYPQSMDPRRAMDSFMQQGMVPDMVQGMVDSTMAGGEGQTLDQIISQNDLELQRRRSTYHPDFQSNGNQQADTRQPSMLEFDASSKHPDRAEFQFGPSPSQPSMPGQIPDTGQPQKASDPRKIRSRESLALDTRFNQMHPAFSTMSSFSPAMMTSTPLDLDSTSQFLSSNMEIPMTFENAGGDRTPMNIQPQIEQQPIFSASPTHQTFSPLFQGLGHDSPAGCNTSMEQSLMDKANQMRMSDSMQNMAGINGQGISPHIVMPTTRGSIVSTTTSPPLPQPTSAPSNPNLGVRSPYGNGGKQSTTQKCEDGADIHD